MQWIKKPQRNPSKRSKTQPNGLAPVQGEDSKELWCMIQAYRQAGPRDRY